MSKACKHGIYLTLCEICEEVMPLERELAAANTRADKAEQNLSEFKEGYAIEKKKFIGAHHTFADEITKERRRADEAIRRLQYMHAAHSDSVKWYQNAVAQALKSLDALPEKLSFDEAMKNGQDADQINGAGMDELRSQWEDILAARMK